jgi:DNA repair exonuclease SbcCD ATPase subunit
MFSYGYSENILLDKRGLVYLLGVNEDSGGDSNGSGKSSIFNSICELLFLENPTGVKGDALINTMWDKGMAGRLIFTNKKGETYRVTYCRKWKENYYEIDNDTCTAYLGTNLFLDKKDGENWIDFRGAGMPDTSKKLLEVVGISYDRFLSIAYMSPRTGDKFLRGTNKDRIDLLSEITDIKVWDSILASCRAKKKELTSKVLGINDALSYERGALNILENQLVCSKDYDYTGVLAEVDKKLEETKTNWRVANYKLRQLQFQLEQCKSNRDNLYNKEKIDKISEEISELNKEITKRQNSLLAVNVVEDNKELKAELDRVLKSIGEVKGEINSLSGGNNSILLKSTNCPLCGSVISKGVKNGLDSKLRDLKKEYSRLENDYDSIQKDIIFFKESIIKKQEKEKNEIITKIEILRDSLAKKTEVLDVERKSYLNYDNEIWGLSSQINEVNRQLSNYVSEGSGLKAKKENIELSLKNIENLKSQISDKYAIINSYASQAALFADEVSNYDWLIENIPFIKLHKLSMFMNEISEFVNNYFVSIGDPIRVNITSFDAKVKKRNAADIKDLWKSEIKIEIEEGRKKIPLMLYSDGELSKISIAIVIALHEIARSVGQGCNILILDEIFSYLDSANSQKLANSVPKLFSIGTVIFTDNSGYVNNLISFDEVWTVRKKDGVTSLKI